MICYRHYHKPGKPYRIYGITNYGLVSVDAPTQEMAIEYIKNVEIDGGARIIKYHEFQELYKTTRVIWKRKIGKTCELLEVTELGGKK